MSQTLSMPQLGESVAEGVVARWLKHEGETVAFDEPLVEIITDKVNAEVPSEFQGKLVRILVQEGQTVPVGTALAEIETTIDESATAALPEESADQLSLSAVSSAAGPMGDQDAPAAGQRRYSPVVRRLAQEHGLNLDEVRGTGLGNRVTRDDVLAHMASARGASVLASSAPESSLPAAPPRAAEPVPAVTAPPYSGSDEELVPLTPMRRLIAEHMVRSVRTAPHAVTMHEVDMTCLVRWRAAHRERARTQHATSFGYVAFVVKAACDALKEYPIVNSSWGGDAIILKHRINMGIAVSLDQGLVVPVIQGADEKNLVGLSRAIDDIVTRARAGTLQASDVGSGTFTVNNVGVFGSVASMAVINQPQAAILTMHAITKRVVVMPDDALAVRAMMLLALSFDHRILDGMTAGRFVQSVQRRLETMDPHILL